MLELVSLFRQISRDLTAEKFWILKDIVSSHPELGGQKRVLAREFDLLPFLLKFVNYDKRNRGFGWEATLPHEVRHLCSHIIERQL